MQWHNFVYKTSITKGVIMMRSKDNFYQEFVIERLNSKNKHNFLRRVDEYYKTRSKKADNIANMYNKTSGDMKEMWKKKWYELVKVIGRKLDETERSATNSRKFTNGQKGTMISDCPVYIESMSGHLEDVRRIEIQENVYW